MRVCGLIEKNDSNDCPYIVKLPYLEIHAVGDSLEQAFEALKAETSKLMQEYLKYSITNDDFKIIERDEKSFDFSSNIANDFCLFILQRLRLISKQSVKVAQENISKTGISNELLADYENRIKELPVYDFIMLTESLGFEVKLSFAQY